MKIKCDSNSQKRLRLFYFLSVESRTASLIAELLLSGNLDQAITQLDAPHDLWPQLSRCTKLGDCGK
jgi:hypothetical protein